MSEGHHVSKNLCTSCQRPATDAAALCHVCTDELARLLRGARVLIGELRTTVAKLDRRSEAVGTSGSDDQPIPFNIGAATVLAGLADIIRSWGSAVSKLGDLPSAVTAWKTPNRNDTASWLVAQLPTIRKHGFASTMLADLRLHTQRALKEIDLPVETVFLGPCETPNYVALCHRAVYAPLGAIRATCRDCGAVHDVAERREWLLASLEELRVTAAKARKLALYLGTDIGQSTISDWRRQEKILPLSVDAEGREEYRFGDILSQKRRLVVQRASVDDLATTA